MLGVAALPIRQLMLAGADDFGDRIAGKDPAHAGDFGRTVALTAGDQCFGCVSREATRFGDSIAKRFRFRIARIFLINFQFALPFVTDGVTPRKNDGDIRRSKKKGPVWPLGWCGSFGFQNG